MNTTDLMGGYAAYTSPRNAVEELATSQAAADEQSPWLISISIIVTILLPLTAY